MYLLYILVLAVILYVFGSIWVLRQYERGVVFLLGKFEGVRGAGLTLVFVPVQQMVRVSLRTVTMQIPSQKIITKDNVSIDIAAVAYYHISDPEKAVIAIENVYNAINQISQTTVRNIVGRFSLDQLLSDTASINEQIKNVIDGHTEPWGTQVTAVEIKDIYSARTSAYREKSDRAEQWLHKVYTEIEERFLRQAEEKRRVSSLNTAGRRVP